MAPALDDLQLPQRTIAHIMKMYCNDATCAMQKDAKLAISRSAIVFVSYVASAAADLSTRKDHRFSAAEIVQALRSLDLDEIADAIEPSVRGFDRELRAKRAKRSEIVKLQKRKKVTETPADVTGNVDVADVVNSTHPISTTSTTSTTPTTTLNANGEPIATVTEPAIVSTPTTNCTPHVSSPSILPNIASLPDHQQSHQVTPQQQTHTTHAPPAYAMNVDN